MAVTDLADSAAAVAAGYAKQQIDRGGTAYVGPRYATVLSKMLVGEPGSNGFTVRAVGESGVSAAAADTAAVANLNQQRAARYGRGTNQHAGSLPGNAGWQHTVDVT